MAVEIGDDRREQMGVGMLEGRAGWVLGVKEARLGRDGEGEEGLVGLMLLHAGEWDGRGSGVRRWGCLSAGHHVPRKPGRKKQGYQSDKAHGECE
jgi:hypothetical protein